MAGRTKGRRVISFDELEQERTALKAKSDDRAHARLAGLLRRTAGELEELLGEKRGAYCEALRRALTPFNDDGRAVDHVTNNWSATNNKFREFEAAISQCRQAVEGRPADWLIATADRVIALRDLELFES
jgi:hypothetical protein